MKRILLGAVFAAAFAAAPALAAEPAVVYDLGGKFDKSFNEAAFKGAEQFKAETGIDYREFEIRTTRSASRRCAGSPATATIRSSPSASARPRRSRRSPRNSPTPSSPSSTSVVDLPNVHSIVFKEQEGSFLVGMLAAMASKTGKVGFVGGMDIPLIRRFACGYVAGRQVGQSDRPRCSRT